MTVLYFAISIVALYTALAVFLNARDRYLRHQRKQARKTAPPRVAPAAQPEPTDQDEPQSLSWSVKYN